jgi:hypothetical protein
MQVEQNTAPASPGAAATSSVELQNGAAQALPDGADAGDPSQAQPGDAQAGEDRTPEHRKASYRFSEMSRQIRDLQLQLARREGALETLRAAPIGSQAAAQNAPTPAAPAAPQAPNPSDFAEGQYDPRFLEALADYRAELKVRAVLDQRAQHEAEERQKEANRSAFEQGQQRFQAVYDQAASAGATGATQVLEIVGSDRQTADLLLDVGHPVETAEWLAENQEWLSEITRERNPVRKAMLVGRIDQHISGWLASQRAQSGRSTTSQAAPGSHPTGPAATTVAQPTVKSGAGGAPFNPASASMDAYEAWRKANPSA